MTIRRSKITKYVALCLLLICYLTFSGCSNNSQKQTSGQSKNNQISKNIDGSYSYLYDDEDNQWLELEIDSDNVLYKDESGDSFSGTIDTKNKKMTFETEEETSFSYEYEKIGDKIVLKTNDGDYTFKKATSSIGETDNSNYSEKSKPLTIKTSPDKYTHYVKNYVGRNASTCGTERLSGEVMDDYGEKPISIIFISETGEQVNSENSKNYVVTAQSPAPNTEIKLTFDTDENGEEYDNLVNSSTVEEIELTVKPLDKD